MSIGSIADGGGGTIPIYTVVGGGMVVHAACGEVRL
jgi:hypothetical protein